MAPPTLLVLNEPMLNSAPPRAPTTFCCATARPVEALTWTTRIAGEHPPFPLHLRVPVTRAVEHVALGFVPPESSEKGLHMNPETELLLRHLNAQRQHVLAAIDGLSDEQLRRPMLPSGWNILGLMKHLSLGDEHYWFRSIVGGESLDVLPEGQDSDWYVADDEAADDIIDLYKHEIEAANAIIAVTALDDPPGQKDPTWQEWGIDFPDLRGIILHVIAETACHAGHLDAARELIDGHQFLVM